MYFDTHTHLDDQRFDEDREAVIASLADAGVTLAVNIGADMESSRRSVKLAERYDFLYAAVGVHPSETGALTETDIAELSRLAAHDKVVAIGEIGLDYYWDEPEREVQKKWFSRQIQLAKELDLPYIVHDRDAHGDTMALIKESGYFRGVMHCFSGSVEMARQMLDLGFYISIAGQVTFKNAPKVREVAKFVPVDRLLIETDSPYLTPEPHRGERNSSAYVPFVCRKIAEVKGMDCEELARITMENGKRFFGIA